MIKTFSTKGSYREIYSQIYEKFRDIHTIIKCQKSDAFYRIRILQNKCTKKFCLCEERVEYAKETVSISIEDDEQAQNYCEKELKWLEEEKQIKRIQLTS